MTKFTLKWRFMIGRFMFSKQIKEGGNTKFLSVISKKSYSSVTIGWSTKKKDYWYDTDEAPDKIKFFRYGKKLVLDDTATRYGLFIGRYALVIFKREKV